MFGRNQPLAGVNHRKSPTWAFVLWPARVLMIENLFLRTSRTVFAARPHPKPYQSGLFLPSARSNINAVAGGTWQDRLNYNALFNEHPVSQSVISQRWGGPRYRCECRGEFIAPRLYRIFLRRGRNNKFPNIVERRDCGIRQCEIGMKTQCIKIRLLYQVWITWAIGFVKSPGEPAYRIGASCISKVRDHRHYTSAGHPQ